MNWNAFDWQTLLWIAGIALLFWFMMRGCGGMMRGGGCGMGGSRDRGEKSGNEEPKQESPEKGDEQQSAPDRRD